ncbi:MAG: hypothetical protein IPM29_31840 [Planctomycetes bacterium]|nr:hypothetical protein [Planctomycetota bacterium]
MTSSFAFLVLSPFVFGPVAQAPLAGSVDTPTFLSAPTPIPTLSATSLGVHGIETISIAPSPPGSSLPYRVLMTVQQTGISDRQARPYDWDGRDQLIVYTGDITAINCRVHGTRAVSDTTSANSTGLGLPILEDTVTDQPHLLAPSLFSNRSAGEYFPDLVIEDGTLSGDNTTTWLTCRTSSSVFGATVEKVVLDLSPNATVFAEALPATRSQVFVSSLGNLIGWLGVSGIESHAGDVGGSAVTALVQEGPVARRRILWNPFGLSDEGVVPLDYGYDDPASEVYDAATFAGTTFVVRGSAGMGVGTEVVRIDTCALPSRVSSALGGTTVQFPIVLPFDMSPAGKFAALFVGPAIPPFDLAPFGLVGQWGIALGSVAVIDTGSPAGFLFTFSIPAAIGAWSIPVQALVVDAVTFGGFASNRASLELQ